MQRRHYADVCCAFKVHIGLVLSAHLLVYHEVKTTLSPDMISVTRPCADHPIEAHEFVLEHAKVAFNVKTSNKQHLLVIYSQTKSKILSFGANNPILQTRCKFFCIKYGSFVSPLILSYYFVVHSPANVSS